MDRADGRVREDEILYVMRHLVTLRLWPEGSSGNHEVNGTRTPLSAAKTSPRAHLFRSYPLLLELAFVPAHLPSMWILPSEHRVLFGDGERKEQEREQEQSTHSRKPSVAQGAAESSEAEKARDEGEGQPAEEEEDDDDSVESESDESDGEDAGDGSDLIEVSVRDLARRALEIVGHELGLGAGL